MGCCPRYPGVHDFSLCVCKPQGGTSYRFLGGLVCFSKFCFGVSVLYCNGMSLFLFHKTVFVYCEFIGASVRYIAIRRCFFLKYVGSRDKPLDLDHAVCVCCIKLPFVCSLCFLPQKKAYASKTPIRIADIFLFGYLFNADQSFLILEDGCFLCISFF